MILLMRSGAPEGPSFHAPQLSPSILPAVKPSVGRARYRAAMTSPQRLEDVLAGYELHFAEDFVGPDLDPSSWLPFYLPQWTCRAESLARYEFVEGGIDLCIEADQPPWSPELNGDMRVSNLQTGVRSGPVGSSSGQHPFAEGLVVRELQESQRLFLQHRGVIEIRMRANPDPEILVALWMIGFEEQPYESAEICVAEIFGRNVEPDRARIGMGIHPFADPDIVDDFVEVELAINALEAHDYAVEWTEDRVTWFVDGEAVRTVWQSPSYAMQLMLNIYEFPAPEPERKAEDYPKRFSIERIRGYRPRGSRHTPPTV